MIDIKELGTFINLGLVEAISLLSFQKRKLSQVRYRDGGRRVQQEEIKGTRRKECRKLQFAH